MAPSLPEYLEQKGVNVEKLSIALYDYVTEVKSHTLDVYKEQELAVEESKYFFFLITGLHYKDAARWRRSQGEEEEPDEDE